MLEFDAEPPMEDNKECLEDKKAPVMKMTRLNSTETINVNDILSPKTSAIPTPPEPVEDANDDFLEKLDAPKTPKAALPQKEVTLIGPDRFRCAELSKLYYQQFDAMRKQCPGEGYDAAWVNQFVGYRSKRTKVTHEKAEGYCRVLAPKSTNKAYDVFQGGVLINRQEGTLYIFVRQRMSLQKYAKMERGQVVSIHYCNLSEGDDGGETARQNRFFPNQPAAQEEIKDGDPDSQRVTTGTGPAKSSIVVTDAELQKRINDKRKWLAQNLTRGQMRNKIEHVFQIICEGVDYMLFAKTREDRDAFMHEINLLCKKRSAEVQRLTNRNNCLHMIQPVPAFNAYNLSIVCVPSSVEQRNFQLSMFQAKNKQSAWEQLAILSVEEDHITYSREGFPCYISMRLRRELYITDGPLWKLPETTRKFKKKYFRTHCTIDFHERLMRFKDGNTSSFEEETYFEIEKEKDIPFTHVIEVKALALDVYKNEHQVKEDDLPYRSKFTVRTLDRDYYFFAKNDTERDIWLESFAKVLKVNATPDGKYNLRLPIDISDIKEVDTNLQRVMNNRELRVEGEGHVVYKSQHLTVTNKSMTGTLIKAVNNIGFFNKEKYHERYFRLEYGQPLCQFKQKEGGSIQKQHYQVDLCECGELDDGEVRNKVEEREDKRSSSFIRRMFHKKETQCGWNFAFYIKFKDDKELEVTYELYAPTRADRAEWLRIFGAIVAMNKVGADLVSMTPITYLRENEEDQKNLDEEEKITESARQRKDVETVKNLVNQQTKLWFKLNLAKLLSKQAADSSITKQKTVFETDNTRIGHEESRGSCQILPNENSLIQSIILGQGGKFEDIQTDTYCGLSPSEIYANYSSQMLFIQVSGRNNKLKKVLFSELSSAQHLAESSSLIQKLENQSKEQNADVDCINKHWFQINLHGDRQSIFLACLTYEETDQWVKLLGSIAKIQELGIDQQIDVFLFRKYYLRQLKYFEEKYSNNGQSPVKISPKKLNQKEILSRNEEQKFESVNLKSESNREGKQGGYSSTRKSFKSQRQELQQTIRKLQQPTLQRTHTVIEGYLWKEIDKKGNLRMTKRHLKYLRIIFNTGKLNIKEDQSRSKMNSFELKNLISMNVLYAAPHQDQSNEKEDLVADALFTPDEIKKQFPVKTSAEQCDWSCMFKLQFPERSFTLSARTRREMDEWTRVFRLFLKMKQAGINLTSTNPYSFERTNKELELATIDVMQDDQTNEQKAPEEQKTVKEVDQANFQSERANELTKQRIMEEGLLQTAPTIAQGFTQLGNAAHRRHESALGNDTSDRNGPIKATIQTPQIFNYNINVQSVTIQGYVPPNTNGNNQQPAQNQPYGTVNNQSTPQQRLFHGQDQNDDFQPAKGSRTTSARQENVQLHKAPIMIDEDGQDDLVSELQVQHQKTYVLGSSKHQNQNQSMMIDDGSRDGYEYRQHSQHKYQKAKSLTRAGYKSRVRRHRRDSSARDGCSSIGSGALASKIGGVVEYEDNDSVEKLELGSVGGHDQPGITNQTNEDDDDLVREHIQSVQDFEENNSYENRKSASKESNTIEISFNKRLGRDKGNDGYQSIQAWQAPNSFNEHLQSSDSIAQNPYYNSVNVTSRVGNGPNNQSASNANFPLSKIGVDMKAIKNIAAGRPASARRRLSMNLGKKNAKPLVDEYASNVSLAKAYETAQNPAPASATLPLSTGQIRLRKFKVKGQNNSSISVNKPKENEHGNTDQYENAQIKRDFPVQLDDLAIEDFDLNIENEQPKKSSATKTSGSHFFMNNNAGIAPASTASKNSRARNTRQPSPKEDRDQFMGINEAQISVPDLGAANPGNMQVSSAIPMDDNLLIEDPQTIYTNNDVHESDWDEPSFIEEKKRPGNKKSFFAEENVKNKMEASLSQLSDWE